MRHCKYILASVVCFGIAGFAVASLASAGVLFAPHGNPTALQAADDPVRNGLRIIQAPASRAASVQRQASDDPAVVMLEDWVYTDGGDNGGGQKKPSPYK